MITCLNIKYCNGIDDMKANITDTTNNMIVGAINIHVDSHNPSVAVLLADSVIHVQFS